MGNGERVWGPMSLRVSGPISWSLVKFLTPLDLTRHLYRKWPDASRGLSEACLRKGWPTMDTFSKEGFLGSAQTGHQDCVAGLKPGLHVLPVLTRLTQGLLLDLRP